MNKLITLFNSKLTTYTGEELTVLGSTDVEVDYEDTKVSIQVNRLQDRNIITPVRYSPWAAPIVPVVKANGSLCICGDYKVTVNRALQQDTYPLHQVEDLLAALAGGMMFS